MPNEVRDNSEARAMQPAGREAVSLMPSQQDMTAFWQNLKLAGTTATREQEMFSQGYTFGNLESLYGSSSQLSEVDSRPIKDYGWQVKPHGQDKVIETGVQYLIGQPAKVTEQGLIDRIGALPLDQQAQVIGAGIKAYNGELTHQQFRTGVGAIIGLGDGVLGLAQGAESLGKAIIGVAQFSRDVMENSSQAYSTASQAGESVGKLLVGGVRVYSAAESYLESVGAATNVGDYGKALRDVAWLGQQMNNRWESMSPEEKTKIVTKLAVENLGAIAAGGVIASVAKSTTITEALEDLGQTAKALGAGHHEKYGKLISQLSDAAMPQKGLTTNGFDMPIPEDAGKFEDLAAKMVGRSGEYIPEHKPMFLAPGQNKVLNEREIEAFGGLKKLESMSDGELASVGLRRYEMPKLKLESDEFSLQAKVPGDNRAWFRATVSKDGTLVLSDLNKGSLPDGMGAHLFAEALKAHNLKPTGQIILKNVIEKDTLPALAAGVLPEQTKIGRLVIKGLKELGITPSAIKLVKTDRGFDIVVDLR
jgi:hypothetical protein